jgi:hypothetical protein
MSRFTNNPFTQFFFFGNYFYGLCTVMLSIEATVQQSFSLNPPLYYLSLFCITVVFYTKAYIHDTSGYPSNERDAWYIHKKKFVKGSQLFLSIAAIICISLFCLLHKNILLNLTALHLFLFFVFPFTAAMYYGIGAKYNIRKIGWLKPFIIGFCWAGIVTWYPILVNSLLSGTPYEFTLVGCLLFLKNFLFVSVLCIMFDIKDYAGDARDHLNTFVVQKGLRITIFYIVIPMAILGLISFIYYGLMRHFHVMKIVLNMVPFILMIVAAYRLKARQNIMYYLFFVDGLMLLKGICGYIAMTYF